MQTFAGMVWKFLKGLRENLSTAESLCCLLQSTIWCQFNPSHRWVFDVTLSLIYVFVENSQFVSDAMTMHLNHTNATLLYVDVRKMNGCRSVQVTITTTFSCPFILITYHSINWLGILSWMRLAHWVCVCSIRTLEVVFKEVMMIIRCRDVKRIDVVRCNDVVVCFLNIYLHEHSSVVGSFLFTRSFAWWRWW